MTTTMIPTTIRPHALALAKELGVERELDAILERGRQTVKGLLSFDVDADVVSEMGPTVDVIAYVDPATVGDPSHQAWWSWRIDEYGIDTGALFLVVVEPNDAR